MQSCSTIDTPSRPTVDYPRLDYSFQQHHIRFVRRIENSRLVCQECGGSGGHTEPVLDAGSGPWEVCGFCEGTGRVTPWMRGQWLRWKRQELRLTGR